MQYDEICEVITTSLPEDWASLWGKPFFLDGHKDEAHLHLAVHRAHVDLRLAWGLPLPDKISAWGPPWSKRETLRVLAEAFWRGSLVARWHLLLVDDSKCYLPDPQDWIVDPSVEAIGMTVSSSEVAVARLVEGITRDKEYYEQYLKESGFIIVSG